MKKILTALLIVTIFSLFAGAVIAATPIVDGFDILSQPTSTWDLKGHSLDGLQVERGDGYVVFALPRSSDWLAVWGVHAFVTFTDATVTGVQFTSANLFALEVNGDDGAIGSTSSGYNDEVDWYTDNAKLSTSLVDQPNELEMWMPTNSGRDGFKALVSYGYCPRMKIDFIYNDPAPFVYGGADQYFDIGLTSYPYSSTIPLAPCEFDIDIKPGSYPNSVNINDHGVVPVAILGSADFDVTTLNPASLAFEGLTVKTKGNGDTQCSVKDVSGANMPYGEPDGYLDLVCQFVDGDGYLATGNGYAKVTGAFYDGYEISGMDEINLVNE